MFEEIVEVMEFILFCVENVNSKKDDKKRKEVFVVEIRL